MGLQPDSACERFEDMELATLGATLADGIQGTFSGDLYRSGDPAYDEARRVWNGMSDRRPAPVGRPDDEAGVQGLGTLARDQGLPLPGRRGAGSSRRHGPRAGGVVVRL